ncbi:hypothetical protein [Cochleicola gelatinilyticus]|uniref:Uncharacterized protein n=1 Tax=Cochleicola gelatinilyticus TaxID=1763537 RepID=A0A167HKB9_9FLAO|nr:hypothetical protein [Cochleicola gelatinilyticus]OAB78699.1 hypothetical protein ULVI_08950 [Cochleicola gelatinilyticus]
MKKSTSIIFGFCLIIILGYGCKNSTRKDSKEANSATSKITTYCFRNEFPFKEEPLKKDIQELVLTVEGDTVKGDYNWLPAEKDQRRGTLTGNIVNDIIEAEYIFMQEGMKDTVEIKIFITDESAEISGGSPELGLTASLRKVDCNE